VTTFFCVVLSCLGRGLASGRSPVQGALAAVQINSETGTGQEACYLTDDDDDDLTYRHINCQVPQYRIPPPTSCVQIFTSSKQNNHAIPNTDGYMQNMRSLNDLNVP